MRTTIDLPDDLHARAKAIARDTGSTLSAAVTMLMRRGLLGNSSNTGVEVDGRGWPIVHADRPITAEDVRELEDTW